LDYFWVFALLSPIFFAVSNLVDNHVLYKRLRDPISYDILTTWLTAPVAIAIFLSKGSISLSFDAWFVGGAVGLAFAFLIIIYCFAMMREQGTNVVSVIYTSPLFVAILALMFLGEKLSLANYAGILLLVSSAFLVLYRRVDIKNPALTILVVYAFLGAVSRVATKSALGSVDVWSYFFWFIVGGLIGSLILAALRSRSLSKAVRSLDSSTLLLMCTTTAFSTAALVLLYTAFSLGPVALASSLSAIQPAIVLLYSAALVRFRPGAIPYERIEGKWAVVRKVGAVVLILLGALAMTGT